MNSPLTLRTERLVLREFRPSDAKALFRMESQPQMAVYQSFEPRTLVDAARYVDEAIAAQMAAPRSVLEFVICLADEEAMIGRVGCHLGENEARLWYAVAPESQGRGYASEAVTALIHKVKNDYGTNAFQIECDPRNVASRRLAEKLGFQLVSEEQNQFFIKGEWCGSCVYRLRLG
jgi:RimJ/RimL family protein N-acetyltransferase